MSFREIVYFELSIERRYDIVWLVDHISLLKCLLYHSRAIIFLFIAADISRDEIRVSTDKLTRSWNYTCRILGPSNSKILTMNLHLSQDESLGGFLGGTEICEGIVSIACNPAAYDRVTILKNSSLFSHLL